MKIYILSYLVKKTLSYIFPRIYRGFRIKIIHLLFIKNTNLENEISIIDKTPNLKEIKNLIDAMNICESPKFKLQKI